MAIPRLSLACIAVSLTLAAAPSTSRRRPASHAHSEVPSSTAVTARRLSLHDRVAQLIVVRGYGDYLNSQSAEYRRLVHWIRDVHVGGMIIANRVRDGRVINAQPYEMAVFLNHLQRLAHTPLFFGSDFERGASMRVAETARYPYMMAFGAAHDLKVVRELGAATAREARALGITWVFAPDADVNNNPDNPIINTRSFGENPEAVAQSVTAFIEGAHADPNDYVLLSAKHFPGHGDTAEDSHMQMAKLDQPKDRIESVELVPFRAAIAHGVDSIMTAHLSVPAFEPQPIPATVSKNILTGLLRGEMGFKGLIVTDAMDMQGLTALFSQSEAAVRAIEAGADVLLMPADPEACIRGILEAVRKGRISQRRIDESVTKVLAAKHKVGLYRSRFVNLDKIADRIKDTGLDELAQKVADESVTLVKDDKHLFPIGNPADSCLTVLTEGRYSSRGENLINTVLRRSPGIRAYAANSTTPDAELSGLAEALGQCKQVYIGAFVATAAYRGSVALEGGLGKFLDSLIKGTAPVALISFGSPYLLRSFPGVSAYAATFSISNTSEIAAGKALLGEIPIQGKLPVSIPGFAKIGDGIRVTTRTSRASQGMQ